MSTDIAGGRQPARSSRTAKRGRAGLTAIALAPFAWLLAAFDIAVLVWILLGSVKTTREVVYSPWSLPQHVQWQNFADAWAVAHFDSGILNSTLLVVGCSLATTVLGAPAAYALSRFKRPTGNAITILFVLGLGIPVQAIFVPLFVAFDRVGLTDSLLGLGILYTGISLPFTVFLLTGFFRSLPHELEESAAIDGLGVAATFWKIMLPLTRSGLITVTVFQAIGFWGETFFALVFLRTKSTISVSLLQFMKTMQYSGARWDVLFAGIVLILAPLIVIYVWLGSRIIEGLAEGYSR